MQVSLTCHAVVSAVCSFFPPIDDLLLAAFQILIGVKNVSLAAFMRMNLLGKDMGVGNCTVT